MEGLSNDVLIIRVGNLSNQVYSMKDEKGWQYLWSVNEGLRLGMQNDRLRVFSLSEAGITPERILSQYPDIEEVYALNTDLSSPLLFVAFNGMDQLADGWHRLLKAALSGVDELYAYFLTPEESNACLSGKFPPGQGLDWEEPEHEARQHSEKR